MRLLICFAILCSPCLAAEVSVDNYIIKKDLQATAYTTAFVTYGGTTNVGTSTIFKQDATGAGDAFMFQHKTTASHPALTGDIAEATGLTVAGWDWTNEAKKYKEVKGIAYLKCKHDVSQAFGQAATSSTLARQAGRSRYPSWVTTDGSPIRIEGQLVFQLLVRTAKEDGADVDQPSSLNYQLKAELYDSVLTLKWDTTEQEWTIKGNIYTSYNQTSATVVDDTFEGWKNADLANKVYNIKRKIVDPSVDSQNAIQALQGVYSHEVEQRITIGQDSLPSGDLPRPAIVENVHVPPANTTGWNRMEETGTSENITLGVSEGESLIQGQVISKMTKVQVTMGEQNEN